MKNLSDRIKFALYKLDISQTEAARRCGMSQQSMHYIIRKNVDSSKLANQIAVGLKISPEWLISGKGKFENPETDNIPIIDNVITLNYFINGGNIKDSADFIVSSTYFDKVSFAYLVECNKIAICLSKECEIKDTIVTEYLIIKDRSIEISNKKTEDSYQIVEWRIFNVIS